MGDYECLEKLYSFAKENGYRVEDLNLGERRKRKGSYKYITLALIIPGKDYKPINPREQAHETTETTTNTPENGEKEQVSKDEI